MSDHDAHMIDEPLRNAGARLRVNRSACEFALAIARRAAEDQQLHYPFVVGLSGAQGSGKTTLASLIGLALDKFSGKKAAILSLDEFYLPKSARQDLARTVHSLCATRGVPVTHDCHLLLQVMSRLLVADDASKTAIQAKDSTQVALSKRRPVHCGVLA